MGGVVCRVPEFWGSRDHANGIAPMARWLLGGERFIQWMGAEATLNPLEQRLEPKESA